MLAADLPVGNDRGANDQRGSPSFRREVRKRPATPKRGRPIDHATAAMLAIVMALWRVRPR